MTQLSVSRRLDRIFEQRAQARRERMTFLVITVLCMLLQYEVQSNALRLPLNRVQMTHEERVLLLLDHVTPIQYLTTK